MADAAVTSILDKAVTRRGEGQVAVVYIHGFLDDRHTWDTVVSHVTAPGFESVQIDLAGVGARGDAAGPFDYERLAADVGAVVDHLGKPFVAVGQSMGSTIAELVAAARTERARGLVLVAPVPLAASACRTRRWSPSGASAAMRRDSAPPGSSCPSPSPGGTWNGSSPPASI